MLSRLTMACALAAAAAVSSSAPVQATEVCHKQDLHNKYLDTDGLWVGACVGDERETPVYVTCGGYYVTCAR